MKRIPVKYLGKPLMPMKYSKAIRLIRESKAKMRYDRKINLIYLQLLFVPSGNNLQDIRLGLDPGSTFDGISVVSNTSHHCNYELIQRAKKGKTAIKSFKTRQAMNRRVRRSRLRHRPIRFSNRTSNKLTPTIKANVDFRKWMITKLLKLFPISHVIVEDVRFDHYHNWKGGRAFSLVEQGKTELYNWITSKSIKLELFNGWDTKRIRVNTFGEDNKAKEKDEKSFEAHCLDSFVLASQKDCLIDKETGELLIDQPIVYNLVKIERRVVFLEKIVKIRRNLHQNRKVGTTRHNQIGPRYYKILKGGIKVPYINMSSHRNVCRVKEVGEHSNHPRKWVYIDNGFSEKFKYVKFRYGGTSIAGTRKFYRNREWNNRNISCSL